MEVIHRGDLFDVLPTLPAESIDAVVTDPPYGIGFMGREWDTFKPSSVRTAAAMKQRKDPEQLANLKNVYGRKRSPAQSPSQVEYDYSVNGLRAFQAWCEQWGREVFRVLKPGGYIVSCGAPRAYHRMASGLEDAGFEIRDCLAWLFGSGFPKSLNIGDGLGTALKPAHEPIVLARKPFKGGVKANVEKHGTGALNIDACRIGEDDTRRVKEGGRGQFPHEDDAWEPKTVTVGSESGRWPANVCLDDLAAMVLDEQSGELTSGGTPEHRNADKFRSVYGAFKGGDVEDGIGGSIGGASRFYYVAKPSREERDIGCYDLPARTAGEATDRTEGSAGLNNPRAGAGRTGGARNIHPTVKPIELMRWLVKLVTPINGTVLDPFTGSGTTGIACAYEQRQFIGIEREAEYVAIAERRIAAAVPLFAVPSEDTSPDVDAETAK